MSALKGENINVDCPCCGASKFSIWTKEDNYTVVRCVDCEFLYLNPRPTDEEREAATQEGSFEGSSIVDISERYSPKKILKYKRLYQKILKDIKLNTANKLWLDIGCGYGEIMKSILLAADPTCQVKGVEPMQVKARFAIAAGLDVTNDFYHSTLGKFDYMSVHDVFSHIPDPVAFFKDARAGLNQGGYLIVETGNLADLPNRGDFPGDLGLPDHMTFAGKNSLKIILQKSGFKIASQYSFRIDGLLYFIKNIVKYAIGRKVILRLPYTSKYRSLVLIAEAI